MGMKLAKDIPLYICGGMGRNLIWDIPLDICGEHGKETGLVVIGKKLVVLQDQTFLDVNVMFYGSKKSILNNAVTPGQYLFLKSSY